jgi:hypothetical protein
MREDASTKYDLYGCGTWCTVEFRGLGLEYVGFFEYMLIMNDTRV